MKKVLVCIRFPVNKDSLRTFKYAYDFSLKTKTKLVVCHIIPTDFKTDENEIKKQTISKIKKDLNIEIEFNSFLNGLEKTVKKIRPDLVIIGAHKRNIMEDIMNDCVNMDLTKEMIKKINVPLLIVK